MALFEEQAVVDSAARVRDAAAFAALVERHRRELQVHCYRMLGSFEDSEDLVQEIFLRAWRRRDAFQGRSTFRAWLYRIATNVCLDELQGRPRTVSAHAGPTGGGPTAGRPSRTTSAPRTNRPIGPWRSTCCGSRRGRSQR